MNMELGINSLTLVNNVYVKWLTFKDLEENHSLEDRL